LHVAKWLYGLGCHEDIRTRDKNGWSPLYSSCRMGHLHVAIWLVEMGAAADLHGDPTNGGWQPLHVSSYMNRRNIVAWILESHLSWGGKKSAMPANIMRAKDRKGATPVQIACSRGHYSIAEMLLLCGAANTSDDGSGDEVLEIAAVNLADQPGPLSCLSTLGHVHGHLLLSGLDNKAQEVLRRRFSDLIANHDTFSWLVLTTVATKGFSVDYDCDNATAALEALASSEPVPPKAQKNQQTIFPQRESCLLTIPLSLLRGHESTLVRLIAEFAGVAVGRHLRNAREASHHFETLAAANAVSQAAFKAAAAQKAAAVAIHAATVASEELEAAEAVALKLKNTAPAGVYKLI